MSILFSREAVIVLAIAASALVAVGSWSRARGLERRKRLAGSLIYLGYALFALSMALYIILGFLSG